MNIPENIIIAANKATKRFIIEAKPLYNQKTLYYSFIDLFQILYGEETNPEKIRDNLIESLNWNKLELDSKTNRYYPSFWNVFLTTNKAGDKCSLKEFKRFIREKFGENSIIEAFFSPIIKELYPDFKDIEQKAYSINFIRNFKLITITFLARIDKNTERELLEEVKEVCYQNEIIKNIIENYFKNHHIEYKDLVIIQKELNLKSNEINIYHYINNKNYSDIVKDVDKYYLISDVENRDEDGDINFKQKIVFIGKIKEKYEEPEIKIIAQEYFENDEDEDEWFSGNLYFKTKKQNKIETDEISRVVINPSASVYNLIDFILNEEKINNIKDIRLKFIDD